MIQTFAHKPTSLPFAAPLQKPVLQRKCACGGNPGPSGECEECRKKRLGTLQRSANGPAPAAVAPAAVHDVLRSPGQPLDRATRSFMEPRFGHDFSHVRVHSDAKAAESANGVNAQAYTVGNNIVFAAGQHAPDTHAGQRLMAHELTHVVQQAGAMMGPASYSASSEVSETQAERMAERIVSGLPSGSFEIGQAPLSIQRQPAQQNPFAGESAADRTRRLEAIEALRTAVERLNRALSVGLLWYFESLSGDKVSLSAMFPAQAPESLADRSTRLTTLTRDLYSVITSLESAPIPAGWLGTDAIFKKGRLGVQSGTQAWRDAQMFYAHRRAAANMDFDETFINIHYVEIDPLPTPRVKAKPFPSKIQTGHHVVLPDEANQPTLWRPFRPTDTVGRNESIVEVWHDDFGYFYMDRIVEGRKHYLPGFNILNPP